MKLLNISQVAESLNVSRTVVRTAIKQGRLKAVRLTHKGTFLVTEQAITDWLVGSQVDKPKRQKLSRDGVADAERHGLV